MSSESFYVAILIMAAFTWLLELALRRWHKRWPYLGITIFSRAESVAGTQHGGDDLVNVFAEDDELMATGVNLQSNALGECIVRIPPRAWSSAEMPLTSTDLVGLMRVDRHAGTIRFSVKIPACPTIFMLSGLGLITYTTFQSGASEAVLIFPLWFLAALSLLYFLMYRRTVRDFWFLASTKLAQSDVAG